MPSGSTWGSERGARAACARCRHFNASPLVLEARMPGLQVLSSAFASVRAQDGLCARHDRYVAHSSVCAEFAPLPAAQPA